MATHEDSAQSVTAGNVTATPVARISVNKFGADTAGLFKVQARPHHVEVTDAGGNHSIIEIVDMQAKILGYIRTTVLACTVLAAIARVVRHSRKRGLK